MALPKDELSAICQQGMLRLKEANTYSQVEVIEKLTFLEIQVSEASFSNILKGQSVGQKMLVATAKGIQEIILKELGMKWVDGQFICTASPDFQPEIVPTGKLEASKKGFVAYEEYRLPIPQKVAFFKDAKEEVIEFGVTLHRFASNLTSGNKMEFRQPIEELLKKGVNFKCYLLKEDFKIAWYYFEDRKSVHPEEANHKRKIQEATDRLRAVQVEFASMVFPGSFEVYEYEHVPYGYYMVVDRKTPQCKLMVSHYLYGIKRGETPVYKIIKKDTPVLCNTYLDSLVSLMKNAKRIIPA